MSKSKQKIIDVPARSAMSTAVVEQLRPFEYCTDCGACFEAELLEDGCIPQHPKPTQDPTENELCGGSNWPPVKYFTADDTPIRLGMEVWCTTPSQPGGWCEIVSPATDFAACRSWYSSREAALKANAPKWPTAEFTIDWPWAEELDPQVGRIVGCNWQTEEVLTVVETPPIQNTEPWTVRIRAFPMPPRILEGALISMDGVKHENPLWYTAHNRAGVKKIDGEEAMFAGPIALIS